jgi:hypothetical protein
MTSRHTRVERRHAASTFSTREFSGAASLTGKALQQGRDLGF